VSGSVEYSVAVGHVFQRKFSSSELEKALNGHNLYMISRRPATRIDEASIRTRRDAVFLDLLVLNPDDRSIRSRIPVTLENFEGMLGETFTSHLQGSYFSMKLTDGDTAHGDAWALGSALLGAAKGIADQEVLYVGQAFGKRGERTAFDRTQEHEKLQRIYEEHAGDAWDIFLSPMIVDNTSWNNWDHLPNDRLGVDPEKAAEHLSGIRDRGNIAPKLSIDLIEHGLIVAFQPPYNGLLREWIPRRPTAAMRKIQDARFRMVTISLHATAGLARYHNSTVTSRERAYTFYYGLVDPPKRPILNPLDPGEWDDEVMQMYAASHQSLSLFAEMSGVVFTWFGKGAPSLRKPPEVTF
jgi:hypothetical protein